MHNVQAEYQRQPPLTDRAQRLARLMTTFLLTITLLFASALEVAAKVTAVAPSAAAVTAVPLADGVTAYKAVAANTANWRRDRNFMMMFRLK
jgi:hypothetical protein